MRKLLPIFAVLAVAAAPVAAQQTDTNAAASEKPKTAKKVVCKPIETDQVIGSRLSATSKICREVTVPVKPNAEKEAEAKAPSGQGF